ncbi:MAG: glycosyltransferase family 2 protein [bacterium]
MVEAELSIIIPCRNEEGFIGNCLDSIMAQDYDKSKYEVIVIDGRSTDKTREIIANYPTVKLLDNPRKIAPAGTNIGIKAAKGEIIVRVDAHAVIAKDFLAKSVDYFNKTGVDCVGGTIRTIGKGYIGEAIALVLSSPFGTGSKFRYSNQPGYVDTVPFGAYRREVFGHLGLFDENLPRSEDLEFNHRIIKAGGKIYMTPEIRSDYYSRSTVFGLLKQGFLNGVDVAKAAKKDRSSISIRHLIPLFFVLGLLIPPVSLTVLLVYGVANLFFSLKAGWKYLPITPFIFLALHLSYGIGTIFGIIKR